MESRTIGRPWDRAGGSRWKPRCKTSCRRRKFTELDAGAWGWGWGGEVKEPTVWQWGMLCPPCLHMRFSLLHLDSKASGKCQDRPVRRWVRVRVLLLMGINGKARSAVSREMTRAGVSQVPAAAFSCPLHAPRPAHLC